MTKLLCAAVLFCGFFAAPAFAQDAPPRPDRGTTVQANCIDENDGYVTKSRRPAFAIQLENKCDVRMVCKVFANISSAKGNALGHGTIRLKSKSAGAKAKGTWTMPVKMKGGNSQSTRECRAI
ncbi:MAG TPA: hypothetical protein VGM57_07585 [Pseudolabrys sp.]